MIRWMVVKYILIFSEGLLITLNTWPRREFSKLIKSLFPKRQVALYTTITPNIKATFIYIYICLILDYISILYNKLLEYIHTGQYTNSMKKCAFTRFKFFQTFYKPSLHFNFNFIIINLVAVYNFSIRLTYAIQSERNIYFQIETNKLRNKKKYNIREMFRSYT